MKSTTHAAALALTASAIGCADPTAAGWAPAEGLGRVTYSYNLTLDVAMDDSGTAFIVWEERGDGDSSRIWCARVTSGGGEIPAVLLATPESGPASPQVAADPKGDALVAWMEPENGVRVLVGRRYSRSGWGPREIIHAHAAYPVHDARLASDGAGGFVAAWSSYKVIGSTRTTSATEWAATTHVVATDATGNGLYLRHLAANAAGAAVLTWVQALPYPNSFAARLEASVFSSTRGWSQPETLDEAPLGCCVAPGIAIDGVGNAMLLWDLEYSSLVGTTSIRAAHFVRGHGWRRLAFKGPSGQAVQLGDFAFAPSFASGVAVTMPLRFSRFEPESGWSAPRPLLTDASPTYSATAAAVRVALDPRSGAAVAVWRADGHKTLYAARLDAGEAEWMTPVGLGSATACWIAPWPVVAARGGVGVAAWVEFTNCTGPLGGPGNYLGHVVARRVALH